MPKQQVPISQDRHLTGPHNLPGRSHFWASVSDRISFVLERKNLFLCSLMPLQSGEQRMPFHQRITSLPLTRSSGLYWWGGSEKTRSVGHRLPADQGKGKGPPTRGRVSLGPPPAGQRKDLGLKETWSDRVGPRCQESEP